MHTWIMKIWSITRMSVKPRNGEIFSVRAAYPFQHPCLAVVIIEQTTKKWRTTVHAMKQMRKWKLKFQCGLLSELSQATNRCIDSQRYQRHHSKVVNSSICSPPVPSKNNLRQNDFCFKIPNWICWSECLTWKMSWLELRKKFFRKGEEQS